MTDNDGPRYCVDCGTRQGRDHDVRCPARRTIGPVRWTPAACCRRCGVTIIPTVGGWWADEATARQSQCASGRQHAPERDRDGRPSDR